MNIFCDESGGGKEDIFLVAAISIDGGHARRIMKDIRKELSVEGEIKGHTLSPEERSFAFQTIFSKRSVSAVSVCNRHHHPGGLLMNTCAENQLWSGLIIEATNSLIPAQTPAIYVTPDAGRYKKSLMEQSESEIRGHLETLHASATIHVGFLESHTSPGVQVADIIANTVYQAHKLNNPCPHSQTLIRQETTRGVLQVLDAQVKHLLPAWAQQGVLGAET